MCFAHFRYIGTIWYWTIVSHRLIEHHSNKTIDHQSYTKRSVQGVVLFSALSITALLIGSLQYTQASEPTNSTQTNSQQMALLRSHIAVEIPQAIGGPDAPYIEEAVLHPYVGLSSQVNVSNVERDKNGISYYIVQEGDTLSEIAELFAVSVNTIKWENDLGNTITVGQELRILPITGIRHTIKKGDTISGIADTYNVEEEDITIFNGVNESQLVIGEKILVPNGVKQVARSTSQTSRSTSTPRQVATTRTSVSNGFFVRPTSGPVTSGFGPRWGSYHYGIDYGAPTGTPIVAAASGTVVKTTCGSGYGNCLVIQHGSGLQTLYAHASVLYVGAGTEVKQGQKVAAVGSTGRSTGPHLHFEIIQSNGQKLNPAHYLN